MYVCAYVCVCARRHYMCLSVPELQLANFISSANIIRRVAYLFYISTFLKNSRSCLLWLGALIFHSFWYRELTFPLHYFFHYVTAWWKALISAMVWLSLIMWSLTYLITKTLASQRLFRLTKFLSFSLETYRVLTPHITLVI